MSLTPDDKLLVLQRFVNSFSSDLLVVQGALADASTPEAAQRYLVGGLNYALDMLDIYPDHHKGIGVADDAIVLRLAARLARNAGAMHAALEPLALDANNVTQLYDELAAPLEQLVAQFPEREVRGRTATSILANKGTRAAFDADITREAKRRTPQPIAARDVLELHKSVKSTLQRAGLIA